MIAIFASLRSKTNCLQTNKRFYYKAIRYISYLCADPLPERDSAGERYKGYRDGFADKNAIAGSYRLHKKFLKVRVNQY